MRLERARRTHRVRRGRFRRTMYKIPSRARRRVSIARYGLLQLGHSDIVVVVADIINVKLERLLLNLNFASSKIGVVAFTGALVIQCLSKGLLFPVSKSRGFRCRQGAKYTV